MASKAKSAAGSLSSGSGLAGLRTPESSWTVNGSANEQVSTSNSQLSAGDLKNIMSFLSSQSGGGSISLEQLLSNSGISRLPQAKPSPSSPQPPQAPQLPKTPQQTPQSQLRSSSSSSSQPGHTPTLGPATPTGVVGGWSGRKRTRPFEIEDSAKRRRGSSNSYSSRQSGEKQHNKGLRHFSQRVCEKVREKGTTTYNEVADELVKELSESEKKLTGAAEVPIDHKNIRRRVYDALNVLMAMNIISKEKKEIRWIGLPTNSVQECQHIESELAQAEERIREKRNQVEELLVQILTFKNLMKRNRERVNSLDGHAHNSAIGLPFIIVNTGKTTTIDCSISSDKSEYVFNFDSAFELHNDIDVLKKMGLDCGLHTGTFSPEDLRRAKTMLPKAFETTIDEIAASKSMPAVTNALPHTPISNSAASISSVDPSPSLTSTPNLTLTSTPPSSHNPFSPTSTLSPTPTHNFAGHSPGSSVLSPLIHSSPASASSLASSMSTAAILNSLTKAATQGLAGTSPIKLAPAPPASIPGTAQVTIPSPRAVTALVNSAFRGKPPPIAARPVGSPSSARAALHSHCPTQAQSPTHACLSPLVKSSIMSSPVAIPAASSPPPPPLLPRSQGGSSSSQLSMSPQPKIVTASKLPVTSEQLNTLLQQALQNPSLLKSLAGGSDPLDSHANGSGHDGADPTHVGQMGQNGAASRATHEGTVMNGLAATTAM